MKKNEIITIGGKVATLKSSTRKARRELIEAKREVLEKIGDLSGIDEDEVADKLGLLYQTIADHILSFSGGLPDKSFFADEEFEDKYLRELEQDFLSL